MKPILKEVLKLLFGLSLCAVCILGLVAMFGGFNHSSPPPKPLPYLATTDALPSDGSSYLIDSNNGHYAQLNSNGNICVYTGNYGNGTQQWCSNLTIPNASPYYMKVDNTGNLCTFTANSQLGPTCFEKTYAPTVASDSTGKNSYYASLTPDGKVCVYSGAQPDPNNKNPTPVWCMSSK